ncbi:MAG: DUF3180 family protein [Propionibacteriales bacterium]|nr:DUF3180 family protein [Propionibacteriales bacterium]
MSSDEPRGHVQVTGPGPLVVLGLVGLVLGWGSRWYAVNNGSPSPQVGWLVVGVAWFIAAVTLGIAYLTRQVVASRPGALTPHQGLSRLVLGKSVARLAAFGLGVFGGVAISRLGVASESAADVILRALVAALGAAAAVAAGLLLEHACRVPPGPDADLP